MAPSAHNGWVPDRLRRYRERHGLTLDQVADAIRNLTFAGFTPPNATFQTVGRHERGESYPGPRYQRAYCELYAASEAALGFRAPLPAETAAASPKPRPASGLFGHPDPDGSVAGSPVTCHDEDLDGLAGTESPPADRDGLSSPARRASPPGSPLALPALLDGLPEPEHHSNPAGGSAPTADDPPTRLGTRGHAETAPAVPGGAQELAARATRPRPAVAGHAIARAVATPPTRDATSRPPGDTGPDMLPVPRSAQETGGDLDGGARGPIGVREAAARALTSDRLRAAANRAAKAADAPLADALSVILAAQREVEDTIGSAPLLGPVNAQLAALMPLVFEARGAGRRAMVDVAAQWAQFAGWLNANTGAAARAQIWLDRAADWAAESGNQNLTANILSYKGHLAWESGAVGPMIGLSQAAQRVSNVYAGQRAYDAGQEARGHAMAGDACATDRKLAEAHALWQEACEHPEDRPPWSYYFTPAFARLQVGLAQRYLACFDVRRGRQAAEDLGAGLAGLPPEMRRAEWAAEYVYHLAVAQIHTAEPEQACERILEAAAIARATGSRRVMNQVRGLHDRVTERWPTLAAVAELTDRLHDPEPPADQPH